jgi:hypothetical protein
VPSTATITSSAVRPALAAALSAATSAMAIVPSFARAIHRPERSNTSGWAASAFGTSHSLWWP